MPKDLEDTPTAKFEPEKVIFSWKAPTHQFTKKGREFWVKLIAIVTLLGFIFFIAEGVMPVILLISVLFLFYVLSSTEPENVEYVITNKGVNIANKKNSWEVVRSFSFVERGETTFLVLNMVVLPGKMELIIDKKDKDKIVAALTKYIPEEEQELNRFDKVSEWVSNKIS